MKRSVKKRFTNFISLENTDVVCIFRNAEVCAALSNGVVIEYRDKDIIIYSLTGGEEISLVKDGKVWREETLPKDIKISELAIETVLKRKTEDELLNKLVSIYC